MIVRVLDTFCARQVAQGPLAVVLRRHVSKEFDNIANGSLLPLPTHGQHSREGVDQGREGLALVFKLIMNRLLDFSSLSRKHSNPYDPEFIRRCIKLGNKRAWFDELAQKVHRVSRIHVICFRHLAGSVFQEQTIEFTFLPCYL